MIHDPPASDTSFKLWQDGEMTLEDRKGIIKRLESVLFALKNSVVKHRVDKDLDALKRRIDCTVDELKKLAEELLKLGCLKAASFIRDYSNTIVTVLCSTGCQREKGAMEFKSYRKVDGRDIEKDKT